MYLLVSGLHIGWGIWRIRLSQSWTKEVEHIWVISLLASWYLAAIIGSIVGTMLLSSWRKKNIYVSHV